MKTCSGYQDVFLLPWTVELMGPEDSVTSRPVNQITAQMRWDAYTWARWCSPLMMGLALSGPFHSPGPLQRRQALCTLDGLWTSFSVRFGPCGLNLRFWRPFLISHSGETLLHVLILHFSSLPALVVQALEFTLTTVELDHKRSRQNITSFNVHMSHRKQSNKLT